MKDINYMLVAQAMALYQSRGFQPIEVPWMVPRNVARATHQGALVGVEVEPYFDSEGHMALDAESWYGAMIGSAEQGFVHMAECGQLKPGKYVSASPCFRVEREYEMGATQGQFFKVELIAIGPDHADYALEMAEILAVAKTFMGVYAHGLEIRNTEEGRDLFLNGLEVGSYGIRRYGEWGWAYGTGLALPRFSTALEKR